MYLGTGGSCGATESIGTANSQTLLGANRGNLYGVDLLGILVWLVQMVPSRYLPEPQEAPISALGETSQKGQATLGYGIQPAGLREENNNYLFACLPCCL